MGRFSKKAMIDYLERRAKSLADREDFDYNDGRNQVATGNADDCIQYGRWEMLCDLVDAIRSGAIQERE